MNYLLHFSINVPEFWKYSFIRAIGPAALAKHINLTKEAKIIHAQLPFIVSDKLKQSDAGCTRSYDIDTVNMTVQPGYTWYSKINPLVHV